MPTTTQKPTLSGRIRQLLEADPDMTADAVVAVLKKEKYPESSKDSFRTNVYNVRSTMKKQAVKAPPTPANPVSPVFKQVFDEANPPIPEVAAKVLMTLDFTKLADQPATNPPTALEMMVEANTLAAKIGGVVHFNNAVKMISYIGTENLTAVIAMCERGSVKQMVEVAAALENLAITGVK